MLFPLIHRSSVPSGWRVAEIVCRPVLGAAALALLALGSETLVQAGPVAMSTPKPTPKPKYVLTKRPHLVAVGPMEVNVSPLAGPRVRRPPLLPTPTPKPVLEQLEPVTPEQPVDSQPVKPTEPSAFSPDAPPTLLPTDKPPATPAPTPEAKAGKKESVLEAVDPREPELRDAVMYFDTPVGPHGSRASIPMVVPFTTPPTVPQPESRATYRKEK